MSDRPLVPAGWYPDPQQTAALRYWDGVAWTGHTHPAASPGVYGQHVLLAPAPAVPFGVGKALRVMLLLQLIGFALLFVAGLEYRSAGVDFLDAPMFTQVDRVTDAEDNYIDLLILLTLTGIAVFVVLIVWTYKTARWAEAQGAALRHAPGWAIGGWFVPLANLVIPFRVLNDLFRAADPELPRPIFDRFRNRPGSAVLWGWLLGWIVSSVLWQWSSRLITLEESEFATMASDLRRGLLLRVIAPVAAAVSVGLLLAHVHMTNARLVRGAGVTRS